MRSLRRPPQDEEARAQQTDTCSHKKEAIPEGIDLKVLHTVGGICPALESMWCHWSTCQTQRIPQAQPKEEPSGNRKVSLVTVIVVHSQTPAFSEYVRATCARGNLVMLSAVACGRLMAMPGMRLCITLTSLRRVMPRLAVRVPSGSSGHCGWQQLLALRRSGLYSARPGRRPARCALCRDDPARCHQRIAVPSRFRVLYTYAVQGIVSRSLAAHHSSTMPSRLQMWSVSPAARAGVRWCPRRPCAAG